MFANESLHCLRILSGEEDNDAGNPTPIRMHWRAYEKIICHEERELNLIFCGNVHFFRANLGISHFHFVVHCKKIAP